MKYDWHIKLSKTEQSDDEENNFELERKADLSESR